MEANEYEVITFHGVNTTAVTEEYRHKGETVAYFDHHDGVGASVTVFDFHTGKSRRYQWRTRENAERILANHLKRMGLTKNASRTDLRSSEDLCKL